METVALIRKIIGGSLVTLVVRTFVILSMQAQRWGYHEVVGTLKPCLMQNNFFELLALAQAVGTQELRV